MTARRQGQAAAGGIMSAETKGPPTMYRFHIEIPDDLWERFKTRAISEYGSPRQAALSLFRDFINRPDSPRQGEPHASDDQQPPK